MAVLMQKMHYVWKGACYGAHLNYWGTRALQLEDRKREMYTLLASFCTKYLAETGLGVTLFLPIQVNLKYDEQTDRLPDGMWFRPPVMDYSQVISALLPFEIPRPRKYKNFSYLILLAISHRKMSEADPFLESSNLNSWKQGSLMPVI